MDNKNQLQEATPAELKSVVYFFIATMALITVLLGATIWFVVRIIIALT